MVTQIHGQDMADGSVADAKMVAPVPRGVIIMWFGLLAAIPTGWQVCDGTNGTPDLRGRFVKGSAAVGTPAGQTHTHPAPTFTGNSATLTHAVTNNAVTSGAGASHTHTLSWPAGVPTLSGASGTVPAETFSGTPATITHSVTQPDDHATQAHDTVNSEPPYMLLAFIMKL